jgi:hypothetical protein
LGLQALTIGLETRSGRILTELALLGDALRGSESAGVAEFVEAMTDTIGHHKT